MKKTNKKTKRTASERKLDMADHGYRVKALGMPERAAKKMVRLLILLIPVAIVVFWFIQAVK